MSVQLKICGLTRAEDFDACERLGVEAVGLNLWAGSKRHLSLDQAAALLDGRTRGPLRVAVFVDPSEADLRAAWERLDLDYVQLHGDAPIQAYAAMRIPYVWVIRGTPDLDELQIPDPSPAWALLDAQVAGFGGAGQTTDWDWAARAVQRLRPLPTWLAGGIDADNAEQAIRSVRPAGLDVASGAELSGAQSGEKNADAIAGLAAICKNLGSP